MASRLSDVLSTSAAALTWAEGRASAAAAAIQAEMSLQLATPSAIAPPASITNALTSRPITAAEVLRRPAFARSSRISSSAGSTDTSQECSTSREKSSSNGRAAKLSTSSETAARNLTIGALNSARISSSSSIGRAGNAGRYPTSELAVVASPPRPEVRVDSCAGHPAS